MFLWRTGDNDENRQLSWFNICRQNSTWEKNRMMLQIRENEVKKKNIEDAF